MRKGRPWDAQEKKKIPKSTVSLRKEVEGKIDFFFFFFAFLYFYFIIIMLNMIIYII